MVWRSWRPNGMLQHGKRAATVAVGAAGAAAANAASAQAECKAALGQERLEEAASLIKDELIKSQDLKSLANSQDGLVLGSQDGLVLSTDGTPWILPRSPDESSGFDLLELSTHIAADPVVVEKIREKAEAQGLLRSIESWPTTRSSSPAFSVLLDSGLELENENERLRLENERLRRENEKLKLEQEPAPPEPAEAREAATPVAAAEAEAAPVAEPAVGLPCAPPLGTVLRAAPPLAVVRLQLEPSGEVKVKLSPHGEAAAPPRKPRKTAQQKQRVRQRQAAAVVATAIVIGLVA